MKKKILSALFLICLAWPAMAITGTFFPAESFSNSLISCFCQDNRGFVWMATGYGLNRFDGYHFQMMFHSDTDSLSLCDSEVTTLYNDDDGRLWIGTKRGLDRYDPDADIFVHYRFPLPQQPLVSSIRQRRDGALLVGTAGYGIYRMAADGSLHEVTDYEYDASNKYFSCIFEDSAKRLWTHGFDHNVTMIDSHVRQFASVVGDPIGFVEWQDSVYLAGQHGMMVFSNGALHQSAFDLSELTRHGSTIRSACTTPDGAIVLGTRGNGLFIIRAGSRKAERFDISARDVDIPTSRVRALYTDASGNLWAGLERKGVLMIPRHPLLFNSWTFDAEATRVSSPISSVCEGDDGTIWAVVQDIGVYGFNCEGHIIAHPQSPRAAQCLYRDAEGNYWLGTHTELYRYDPRSGKATRAFSFDCDHMNAITASNGRLFVSTFSRGLCIYDLRSQELRHFDMYDPDDEQRGHLCNNWILSMMTDNRGRLWLGTSSGTACYDPSADSFLTLGTNCLLEGRMCYSLCQLRDGAVLIGTDNGLYRYNDERHEAERFPASEVLSNRAISYIVQTDNGDIWCSTFKGIWQYDNTHQRFIGYENGNGLITNEYLISVGLLTHDDRIIFANNHGLTAFQPSVVSANRSTPGDVHLVQLIVNGQTVSNRTKSNRRQIFKGSLDSAHDFSVAYADNSVTLAFSLMDFENPTNVGYEFSIDNSGWQQTALGTNSLSLNHLQPGTYHIHVRALTSGGYSSVQTYTLTVRPPWWKTTLARLLLALILCTAILTLLAAYQRRNRERQDEEKMKFLINATHDIRSPLTLIHAPLQKLKQGLKATPGFENNKEMKDALNTIELGAERVLNLVNQILDIRRIDKQQMALHCRETDLVAFVKGICSMFDYNANERHISFSFQHQSSTLPCWIDPQQFDKVISNLLSNAFKFTPDGSSIEINLHSTDTHAVIQVSDNGKGIDEHALRHIFDRFYQARNSQKPDSSGIGLNLCKMIVEMHRGTITAHNRHDGQGACFTVMMPLGNAHLRSEEMDIQPAEEAPCENSAPEEKGKTPRRNGRTIRILVVDDDLELSRFIASQFNKYYIVATAANGKEGLHKLLTHNYDLVVSDVLMPEMDGFSMLRMIKSNLHLSHIPVILLTSQADVSNRLTGLEHGADAFVAKPFDLEELHLTIENLIEGRQRLKGKFSGAQQQTERVEKKEQMGNDEQLMQRIMKSVNKNLSDSDFNIERLTQEVGISRAQLHRKMKEITGLSTSEFIRNIRLEQAARLLKEQKINVTQVAYSTGFSNLAHFSTVFRKHFGCSPSDFATKQDE